MAKVASRQHLVFLLTALVAGLGLSCDRERVNPVDPFTTLLQEELLIAPANLTAEGGLGAILLEWEPVNIGILAGYALYRSENSTGPFLFVSAEKDTTAPAEGEDGEPVAPVVDEKVRITTGQTAFIDSLPEAAGQTFFYKIASVDTSGRESELSKLLVGATVVEDLIPPAAPRNISAAPDGDLAGRIVVRWNPPIADVGGGLLTGLAGYAILRAEVGVTSFVVVDSVDAETREFLDVGLKSRTTYQYTVAAFDPAGNEGPPAAAVTTLTQGVAVPAGLTAVPGIGRIVLGWTPNTDTGLQGYNVYRSSSSSGGFSRLSGDGGDDFTTGQTSYIDSNLTGGQLFFYKVSALTEVNESDQSTFVSGEVQFDEVGPGAPTDVVAIADETESLVVLTWSAPLFDRTGGPLTGLASYIIFRSKGTANTPVPLETLVATQTTYTDTDLEEATQYFYSVQALDVSNNRSPRANSPGVVTPGVAVPANLGAVNGIGQITLTWNVNADPDVVGYNVYRSNRSDTDFVRLDGDGGVAFTTGQTVYVDSNLVGGQLFFYKVSAVTDNRESQLSRPQGGEAQSDDVSPSAPADVVAIADEVQPQVDLTWSAPLTDRTGGPLTGLSSYIIFRSEGTANTPVPIATVPATQTQFVDIDLKEATQYFYSLQALDASENRSVRASAAVVVTPGVPVPLNLSAAGGIGQITLNWRASPDPEVVGYNVFRSTRSDAGFALLAGEGVDFTTGQTSYIDSNLAGGQLFFYKVSAVTSQQRESAQSTLASGEARADDVPPAAPADVVAIADEVAPEVVLTWSAPLSDRTGGPLTGLTTYIVFRSKGTANTPVSIATLPATQTRYVDADLEEATLYFYSLQALDGLDNRSVRATASGVTTSGVPVPLGLNVVDGIGRITLAWNASSDPEVVGYNVFRSTRSDSGFARLEGDGGALFTTGQTSYIDSNLAGGELLFYKVSAVADQRESAQSIIASGEAQADDVPPAAPTDVVAIAGEVDAEVVLTWSAPLSDRTGGPLTGLSTYIVFRSENTPNTPVSIATLPATRTRYVDSNLDEATQYFYSVLAVDGSENLSVRASAPGVTTSGVPVPVGLSATGGIGQISLTWNASADPDVVGYNVFRSNRSDAGFVRLAGDGGGSFTTGRTSYIDLNLADGQLFFYRVSAVTDQPRESALSTIASGESGADDVPPAAPTDVVAIAGEVDPEVTLTWSAPLTDRTGDPLTGLTSYIIFRSEGSANTPVEIVTVPATQTLYMDTGLEEATLYFYSLQALDGLENRSVRATAPGVTTSGVPVPVGLAAAGGIGQITLTWNASGDPDVVGYNVFRSARSDTGFARLEGDGGENFTTGQTSYIDSNLAGGDLFFYKVSAVTDQPRESAQSIIASGEARSDDVPPAAPSDLVAIADEVAPEVDLTWSAPLTDRTGGPLTGLTSYIIFRSEGTPNTPVPIITLDATETQYTDSGLEEATQYFYSIIALDNQANRSNSATTPGVTTSGVAVPTNLNVSEGIGQITLNWNASTDVSVVGYNVFRSERSDGGYSRLAGDGGATFTTGQTSYIDSNLVGGQLFFYKVSAVTELRQSAQSTIASGEVQNDNVSPGVPTNLVAIADDLNTDIVLTWGEPTADQNGGPLTGLDAYIISRSVGTAAALVIIDTVGAAQTQYTDTGLESATTYFYTVTAFDSDDNVSPRSNIASAVTPGITPPAGLNVAARINAIDVSWNDSTDPDLIGYNVYRSTRSDSGYEPLVIDPDLGFTTGLTIFVDEPLIGGDTYYYRISAVTTLGESDLTSFRGGTVLVDNRAPGPPSFIEGDPVLGSPNDLVISWNAPATDFNGALLTGVASYQIYRAADLVGPFDLVGSSATNSFTDMDLLTRTTYFYEIEAIDAAGNVGPRSGTVALVTGGVDIPKNVVLSVFVPESVINPPVVTISWDSSAGAILDYELQRTTVALSTLDSDYVTIQPTDDSTTRQDDTVSRGNTYYYRIRARDIDNNRSSWTDIRVISVPNP